MAKIQPEITPNFRTKCDGFFPHFLIQIALQGKSKKKTNRKMAKIQPKITPNFRTKCDGFFPHFLIQMGLKGNSKKVNNFGLHREERNDRYGSSGLLLLIPRTGKTFPFMRVHPLSSCCLVNLYLEITIRNRP